MGIIDELLTRVPLARSFFLCNGVFGSYKRIELNSSEFQLVGTTQAGASAPVFL
jgi:hypothetical protein